MSFENLYEKYHSQRAIQKRVVSPKNFTYRNILLILDKFLTGKRDILDIGCGVGTISMYLASKGHKVVGIDISSMAVNNAIKSSNNIFIKNKPKFKVIDFSSNIQTKKVDAIVALEILEHLENDEVAVKNLSKILKTNGLVIASSPSLNAPLYKLGLLKNFDKRVGHLRRYSQEQFKKLFINNGFKIVEMKPVEGVIKNFLFTNSLMEKMIIRFIKGYISDIVNFFDNFSLKMLGESDIIIVAQKK